jgi:leucyl aminopeptidase
MPIAIQLSPSVPADAEVLGVGVYADRLEDGEVPGPLDASYLTTQGFTAKPGETLVAPGPGGQVVVALGLGDQGEVTTKVFRKAAAALARAAHRQQRVATTLLADVPGSDPEGFGEGDGGGLDRAEVARALAEGTILGAYRYTALKSDPEASNIVRVDVVAADEGADGSDGVVTAAFDRGVAIAQAVCLARDLVNEPGGELTPTAFADKAVELARSGGFTAEVLDRQAIEGEKMGGLLGVNRGSEEEPRFVKLAYEPESPRATIALVGKGITFDSGGLDLKTAEGMLRMKDDMSGAAAVLGIMKALPQLRPAVEVHGLIAATENMPSGTATRPGDVLRAMNGTTIEIGNTDAEGRLTLADAICYASQKVGAEEIIDMATLTGACVVALGPLCSGLFANDQALADRLLAAAETAGERVWQLPLIEEYRENLKSDVADLNNVGPRGGGAITAGLFLKEFAGDKPWAHLDIAGPAFIEKDTPLAPKGATGYAVRTILTYLIEAGR